MLRLGALVVVLGCGGRPPAPASGGNPPPPKGPATTACTAPTPITVESCVVGGMPDEQGNAVESCGTACRATPPAGDCSEVSPGHYKCMAYAP